jgi:hypothetical protein
MVAYRAWGADLVVVDAQARRGKTESVLARVVTEAVVDVRSIFRPAIGCVKTAQ